MTSQLIAWRHRFGLRHFLACWVRARSALALPNTPTARPPIWDCWKVVRGQLQSLLGAATPPIASFVTSEVYRKMYPELEPLVVQTDVGCLIWPRPRADLERPFGPPRTIGLVRHSVVSVQLGPGSPPSECSPGPISIS